MPMSMITRNVSALGVVLVASAVAPAAHAADPPGHLPVPTAVEPAIERPAEGGMQLHYTVETGVATTYVFRGVPQYVEKTDPSSMTTLSVTLDKLGPGALSVGAWIAAAITDRSTQPTTKTEIDLTATYGFPIGSKLAGAVGYILYLYPDADTDMDQHVDGAHELWASVSVNDLPVTPTVAVYVEPVRLKGFYGQLSVSKIFAAGPFTISPWMCLALSKYDAVAFGVNDVTATLPVKWSHASGFYASLSASYAYSGLLDDGSFSDKSTLYALLVAGFSR